MSLSLGGIHSCCMSPTWVLSSLAGAGKLFSFLCMKYKTFAENKTRPWQLPTLWDSFCTFSPKAWTHPLCRGLFVWHLFLGCVEKVGVLAGKKSAFFPPNVWLNVFCVCGTLTPSWRLLQHCLQGINLHLLYLPIICLAFGETDAANCLENLDNDLKGNQWKLWEENWGLCSESLS